MAFRKLPFSQEDFLNVFTRYNTAIFPAQILAYALGLFTVVAAWRPFRHSDRLICGVLALLWIWVGAAYHIGYFRAINPAAVLFGGLFILQGAFFIGAGIIRQQLRFQARPDAYGIVGSLLILFALAIYPALCLLFGHVFPKMPVFGVTPCPLLIFTFGMLLYTTRRFPWYLYIIPCLWSLVGISAALSLGIRQDFALILSAIVTITMLTVRNRRETRAEKVVPAEV